MLDKTNLFTSQLFQDKLILLNSGLDSIYLFSVLRFHILLFFNSALNDTKLGLEDEVLGCVVLVKLLLVRVLGSFGCARMVVKRSLAL